ncbi:fructosamine kinase [Ascodesmis nigricans]|uniref:protein-ribulosamine 3-kinase n=1 Tax=Ascodesmis nigricans TaxID=341454 RepID=A0A4S2MRK7_9PEZI|nr:fructosamine kinase [Ascodesmis nigricans]
MKLDPAIISALDIDPTKATLTSHGGSGFSSTYQLTTQLPDGSEKRYFVKTGKGEEARVMFEGEYTSLNALHSCVPTLCPQAFSHGPLSSSPSTYYLITTFLSLSRTPRSPSTPSLATKLAQLHSTPAPADYFGFPVTTCCGSTPQNNTPKSSWAEFYAENRITEVARRCEEANGGDGELRGLMERVRGEVVPRLLGRLKVRPVVVHGDLWSGNGGVAGGEEVVFDPSSCYAHNEYEFGIMKMFGGFGDAFWKEYHSIVPKAEPVEEYEDRVELYELYHHLNHHALFGSSYRAGAVAIMKRLVGKYGKSGTKE